MPDVHDLRAELHRRTRRVALCVFLFVWLSTGVSQGARDAADYADSGQGIGRAAVDLLFALINGIVFGGLAAVVGSIISALRLRAVGPNDKRFSSTRRGAIAPLLSAVFGIAFGVTMYSHTAGTARAAPPAAALNGACTPQQIDATLAQVVKIHTAMWETTTKEPSAFHARLAQVMDSAPDCSSVSDSKKLTEPERSKWGAIALIGLCDAAITAQSAGALKEARSDLDACLGVHETYRAVATARDWTTFFVYEKRFMPLLKLLDKNLTEKGFPPARS